MIKINLLNRRSSGDEGSVPKKEKLDQAGKAAIRKFFLSIVVGIFATYMLESYKEDEMKKTVSTISKLREEANKLQSEINAAKDSEALKKSHGDDETTLRAKIEAIQSLNADRSTPSKILIALANAIPKEVWLSEFSIEKTEIVLRGASLGFSQVSDFMKNLNENAYFGEVALKTTQQNKDNTGLEIATFELSAKRK